MANDAAWEAGWDMGAGRKKKDKSTSDQSPDVDMSAQNKQRRRGKGSGGSGGGNPWSILNWIPKFKHGGRVKRTGLAMLHKGEHVIPAKKIRKAAGRKKTIIKA